MFVLLAMHAKTSRCDDKANSATAVVVVVLMSVFELTVMKVIKNNNYKVYKHINISPAEMECVIFTLLLIFCPQLTFRNIQMV